MYNFPFIANPYYRRPFHQNQYFNTYNKKSYYTNLNKYTDNHYTTYSNHLEEKKEILKESTLEHDFFEIFGLKLYYDDILLICLLFFLYNEGVKDQYLFISLILLLIS